MCVYVCVYFKAFLSSILGLMSPSSTHPCPICIINKSNFSSLSHASHRNALTYSSSLHSSHPSHTPLLSIPPNRVVPLPLHIMLGVCNKIILHVLKAPVRGARTTHTARGGGVSSIHELNGNEIARWLKTNDTQTTTTTTQTHTHSHTQTTTTYTHAHAHKLIAWMKALKHHLLHAQEWNEENIATFDNVVKEIITKWGEYTSKKHTPKLHMLTHCVAFVKEWKVLGKVNESQIESYHAQFNRVYNNNHYNMGRHHGERMRRTMADLCLNAIQPVCQKATDDTSITY